MIPFAEYMDRVLYGPAGYYSTGIAKSGKNGDYFTAPDVGSVFGQLLAEIVDGWKEKLNSTSFSIIEVGAGEGRLAQDILKSSPMPYTVIERSQTRRDALKTIPGLTIYEDLLSAPPMEGVLFGNELVDAFPVHRIAMKKGRLLELYVEEGTTRRFVWSEPSSPKLQAYLDRLKVELPDGYETEINLAMAEWLRAASHALSKGILLLIDYGRPAHEYYAPERTRGTLRAFSKHKVSADFLDPNGMVDLTADVDFSSLALDAAQAGFIPLAFMELGTFLLQGVERHRHPETLDRRGLKYLIHPEGMGSAFHVLVLGKNIQPSDWAFEHNRLKRL